MTNKIGKYRKLKQLGSGGNGIVYEVTNAKQRFALKTLKNFSKSKSYQRFKDEITALKEIGFLEGIIPILDSYIPTQVRQQDLPYYIMPIGQPFEKYLEGKNQKNLFKAFIKISRAVSTLHSKEFTHRDIKPNNMMFVNGEPVLSDFGLVSFPGKTEHSDINEKIGAAWTIAPEMQRTSSTAEFKKADVYSLAKTLWILITGNILGFEGQYIPRSNISLDNFIDLMINKGTVAGNWYYHSIVLLEDLLKRATDNDANKRPSAAEFTQQLEFWLSSNENFQIRNPYEWETALLVIFPNGIPTYCEWNNPEHILSVLKVLTNYDNLNHFFYPKGGGDDMKTVEYNLLSRSFILNGDDVLTVERLIFQSLGEAEWSYFRLVVEKTEPNTDNVYEAQEEYIADDNFQYVSPLAGDNDESEEIAEGIEVRRFLEGSFLIIQKTSEINQMVGTYRGESLDGYTRLHEKLSYEEYNEVLRAYKERITNW